MARMSIKNNRSARPPALVFMVLPGAFAAMPFGTIFGGLFFALLAIAALTSTVSLLEVPVAYAMVAVFLFSIGVFGE